MDNKKPDNQSIMKQALLELREMRAKVNALETEKNEPLAIVGMGCRYPGNVDNPESFWKLIREGKNAVTEVPKSRWDINAYYDPDLDAPGKMYTRYGGFVDNMDQFDAGFFGITPREASCLDPKQRLVLEVAWESLENANIPAESLYGSSTGVFVGIGNFDYMSKQLTSLDITELDNYYTTGSSLCVAAGRISYILGLTGPSFIVDTACSSSSLAIHLACQSLRFRESNLAIAGGVNMLLSPEISVNFCRNRMLSADGKCKAFDASGDGYVRGEGCGMVVLKRLSDAKADNNNIIAIIRGSSVNQDGASGGLTVPSGPSQEQVIRQALDAGNVKPEQVSYIEAHGTGTSLGDPIEIGSIGKVFANRNKPLIVGSVKTNIGHLEPAAGVSGLMKVALSLQHCEIPPNLHFNNPNPRIPWDSLQVKIPTELTPWTADDKPRIAGVSSFGFSGTNVHIVIEQAPADEPKQETSIDKSAELLQKKPAVHLLALSAKTEKALHEVAIKYDKHLKANPQFLPQDVCHSANAGRSHFIHRLAVIGDSTIELASKLSKFTNSDNDNGIFFGSKQGQSKPVFIFTGNDALYTGMGLELYESSLVFRKKIDYCQGILNELIGQPARDILFAGDNDVDARLSDDIVYAWTALFAVEYAFAELWKSWGVKPSAVMGHGIGEYVAACVSGVFNPEDGLKLVFELAGLISTLPDNLKNEWIEAGRLNVPFTSNSQLIEPVLDEFKKITEKVKYSDPRIRLISGVEGVVASSEISSPEYWTRHICSAVKFEVGIDTLNKHGLDVFLVIGPDSSLTEKARIEANGGHGVWLPAINHEMEWRQSLLNLGEIYIRGAKIDWAEFGRDGKPSYVALPTYPFQRQRHWFKESKILPLRSAIKTTDPDSSVFNPLTGRRLQSALNQIQYESRISASLPAFLNHHRVYGKAMLPAAAFIEIGLAAGADILKTESLVLEDVVIHKALALEDDETKTIQTILSPEGDQEYSFQVFCLTPQDENRESAWELHASGRVFAQNNKNDQLEHIDLDALINRHEKGKDVNEYYSLFSEHGIDYGSDFQALEQVWRGDNEAVAKIKFPKSLEESPDHLNRYKLHPVILDACFQLLMTVLPEDDKQNTYLPVSIKRLELRGRLGVSTWGTIRLYPEKSINHNTINASLELYNESGSIVATANGIVGVKTNPALLLKDVKNDLTKYMYDVKWKPIPVESNSSRDKADKLTGGTWLIFDSRDQLSPKISEYMKANGELCKQVFQGRSYEKEDDCYHVDPLNPSDFNRLLNDVAPIDNVLYMWGIDEAEPLSSANSTIYSVLHFVKALVQNHSGKPPRLWFITRGAQRIKFESPSSRIGQSFLWGIARVIEREHPDMGCVSIDLDSSTYENELRLLYETLKNPDKEAQIAWRDGVRYAARLTRVNSASDKRDVPLTEPVQVRTTEYGILENLTLKAMVRSEPKPGCIEIKIHAAGLNFRDTLRALGMFNSPDNDSAVSALDDIPFGIECAGRIARVGKNAGGFKEGDAVFAVLAIGSLGSYVNVRHEFVAIKPENISFEEAATVPLAFLTAHYGLNYLAGIKEGDKVLIHAAAGGVGMAAIQLVHNAGAVVYATAGRGKWDFLRSIGVEYVADSRSLDFADYIMDKTNGQGVDVVLNSLNGEFIPKSIQVCGKGARFLEVGKIGVWDKKQVHDIRPDISYSVFDIGEIADDNPALISGMFVELINGFKENRIKPLPHTCFSVRNAAGAFRYMAQAKHIGKIVINNLALKSPQWLSEDLNSGIFAGNGTCLITGGFGALGLLVAVRLVNDGVRYLALIGRNGAGHDAKRIIERLRGKGAKILSLKCDISQEKEAMALFGKIIKDMPTLKGIIHAAGILDDEMIVEQKMDRFAKVMAPKVNGAWNLHRFSEDEHLDFFVMFSSAASIMGNPGQGSYAAANAFLDALVSYRRARGLVASTINWGAWAQVGMAVDKESGGVKLTSHGVRSLKPEDCLDILKMVINEDRPQTCVLDIDWQEYVDYTSDVKDFKLFEGLTEKSKANARNDKKTEHEEVSKKLDNALPEQRQGILIDIVQDVAKRVIGLDKSLEIPVDKPLMDEGFDSLMAVEMRNRLDNVLGVKLPVTLLFDYPTIEKISDYIAKEISGKEKHKDKKKKNTVDNDITSAAVVLNEIDDLLKM
ncbi:MAG: SDR family NAD(P)-dependent oxidoreductase [Candidatus Anammoxibacter sp.]